VRRVGPRLARPAAAALAGLLAVLAAPGALGGGLFAVSFGMLLPLLWALDGARVRAAFAYGHLCGMVAVGLGFSWIETLLTRYAGVPGALAPLVLLLFAGVFALQFSLPAAFAAFVRRRTGRPMLLAFAAPYALCEVALPTIFPMNLAIAWAEHPAWIQLADLGGVTLVTFALVALQCAVYDLLAALRRGARRAAAAWVAIAAGIAAAVPSYGQVRLADLDQALAEARRVRFGLVQGNMAIEDVLAPGGAETILRKHQAASADLERRGAELLVWGETAYPFGPWLGRARGGDLPPSHPYRVRRGFAGPLVVGYVDEAEGDPYPWNTARVLRPDGTFGDRYDKVYRLLFGEYVPLVDPAWFQSIFPTASHLHRGEGPTVLRAGGLRLGPLICYEDVLEDYARQVAALDIDLFVNLTNDAWFGGGAEPRQHLALAVFRTVEHRRAMVRAVTTGVSAHIDPGGRILARTRVTDPATEGPQPPDTLLADAAVFDRPAPATVYARAPHGKTVLYLALVTLAVVPARRRRCVGRADLAAPGGHGPATGDGAAGDGHGAAQSPS